MNRMFNGASFFNQDISNWNVSSIGNMSWMFNGCTVFNQNIGSWNTSSVSSIGRMFGNAVSFNQDISNWDVSGVDSFFAMFSGATSFDQDLSTWDVSSATGMSEMLNNSAMSVVNYDSTLIAWSQLTNLNSLTLEANTSQYCVSESARNTLIHTYGWTINDSGKSAGCEDLVVSPKIYLQGAAISPNTGEEALMRDDLRVAGYLPTTSPYLDGITCNASVFSTTGNDAIVDWVLVELRNELDNTKVMTYKSALLQRDGNIVGIDGVSDLSISGYSGNYYVVIKHRSHLGMMSTNTISLSGTTSLADFTNVNNQITYGINAQTTFGMPSGIIGMWAGNVGRDISIRYQGSGNDTNSLKDSVLGDVGNVTNSNLHSFTGYNVGDINLDGTIRYQGSGNDTNTLKDVILSHPGNQSSPSNLFTITEQLPEN